MKSSRENLVISDDAEEIDQALEEAFTKTEVNEVHKEPEIEQPQVRFKIEILHTSFVLSLNVSLVVHHLRLNCLVDDSLDSPHLLK